MSDGARDEKNMTDEELDEMYAKQIKEIEKREAINIPKLNYKWYEINETINIEIYIKGLQEGEVSAHVDENDASVLYITVKGEEHKFDLFGPVANPTVAIKRTKAEVSMKSTGTPAHFPVLLKAEGRINEMKQKKYAELDKIGEKDKKKGDFFNEIYAQCNDDQRRAMMKSL